MGKRRRILLVVLLVVIPGAICWLVLSAREPLYKGRSLSAWAARFHTNRWPLDAEAKTAVQHFGTNAIPVLLDMMSAKESPLKLKLLSLPPKQWRVRLHLPSTNEYHKAIDDYRSAGASAFIALGEQARPAVPDLIALLDSKVQRVRYLAVFALRTLGPVAKDALPPLLKCLDDPDFAVRDDAVVSLGTIHEQPELAIPAITNFIANNGRHSILIHDAIDSLKAFGAEAKPAVPTILPFLHDKDPSIREAAANAIKKIDPDAAIKADVK